MMDDLSICNIFLEFTKRDNVNSMQHENIIDAMNQ